MNHKDTKENSIISASLMCTDIMGLQKCIATLEEQRVEYLHVDVMDGEFVPNFGLGIDYINGIRRMTEIPLDIHMMVTRPEEKLEWIKLREADRVIIHYESTIHLQRTLVRAKSYGCKVMLAVNPGTPIYSVEEVLDYIDGISILTVNPGFAGQKIVKSCVNKVVKVKHYLCQMNYSKLDLEVDGNVNFLYAKLFKEKGANIFVAGSSSIFDGNDLRENLIQYRKMIQ